MLNPSETFHGRSEFIIHHYLHFNWLISEGHFSMGGIIKSVPYNQCIRKIKLNYPCKIVKKKNCKMLILTNTVEM